MFACITVCSVDFTLNTSFRSTTNYIVMSLAVIKDANVVNTSKAINY